MTPAVAENIYAGILTDTGLLLLTLPEHSPWRGPVSLEWTLEGGGESL
jgi:hypothetical protein